MEYITIPNADLKVSRIALGTWAIGGWMWGGTDEQMSIRTVHSALCRGLLSGKMSPDRQFSGDDLRRTDPKFQEPRYRQYLEAANRIEMLARQRYSKELLPTAIRWILDQDVDIAIWGARRPEQINPIRDIFDWSVDSDFKQAVDAILSETIQDPIGPDFMAPPHQNDAGLDLSNSPEINLEKKV